MKDYRYIAVFAVLVIVQIVLCNFLNLSRFMVLSILPALVLMLPVRLGDAAMMLTAFVLGFLVDFFSTGTLGLTSFALVPAALARNFTIGILFGDELGSREGELSVSRFGLPKFVLSTLILCVIYFALYVWVDAAGTMKFWECFLRFLLSTAVSLPVCVLTAKLLRPE